MEQKLKNLFKRRTEFVKQCNEKILSELDHVVKAVERFLSKNDIGKSSTPLNWEDVMWTNEIFPDQGGMLILVATIDEQYQTSDSNVVRIMIPFQKATTESSEQIEQFLYENAVYRDYQDDQLGQLEGIESFIDVEEDDEDDIQQDEAATKAKQAQALTEQQFDFDQLTDEQREQLNLFFKTADNLSNSDEGVN